MSAVRILTYNIRGGLGMDGRRDTLRVAAVVSAWQPDIVCFQEVHQRLPWSGWIDQPQRLTRSLKMPVVFQANVRFLFGGYGVAIATRFPRIAVSRHRLPSTGEPRGALEAELETPHGPLTVFNTHWGLKRSERDRQAAAVVKYVRAASSPVIVCGDLNALPDAAPVARLRYEAGLQDWGAGAADPTYPSEAPLSRIDVIFGSAGLRADRVFVIESQASDHLPVVADFYWAD